MALVAFLGPALPSPALAFPACPPIPEMVLGGVADELPQNSTSHGNPLTAFAAGSITFAEYPPSQRREAQGD
jgi:hypothetical protein